VINCLLRELFDELRSLVLEKQEKQNTEVTKIERKTQTQTNRT